MIYLRYWSEGGIPVSNLAYDLRRSEKSVRRKLREIRDPKCAKQVDRIHARIRKIAGLIYSLEKEGWSFEEWVSGRLSTADFFDLYFPDLGSADSHFDDELSGENNV